MLPDEPDTGNDHGGRSVLLLIFLLSGASGLIYQVVWTRSLMLVFGSTTQAVSTVLAAFMGGLALGSVLAARRGDRLANPLRTYAWIELAIAGMSVAVLGVLPALTPIYRAAHDLAGASPAALDALRFLLAGLALLPPTTLMGATLPILSAHAERAPRRGPGRRRVRGSGAGALYAANTIGAVAGTAIAGFALLPALGMTRSALVAAAANLAAAVAAWLLSRKRVEAALPAAGPAASREPVPSPADTGRFAALLLVFAASGAGALIFEVVWTRILSLVLGSSTQAFTIMLTTFLTGLALGSAFATRLLPRIRNPIAAFALVELGAGASALLGVTLFPELPYAFLALFRSVGDAPLALDAGRFLIAAVVMLPTTLILGAAFPLAARAALADGPPVSRRVGVLYTWNTVGAIIGSTAAGFSLIPSLGLQGTLVAGCLILLASGGLLVVLSPGGRPVTRLGIAALLLICLPGLFLGMPPWNRAVMTSGVFQYAPRYVTQFQSRRQFLDYHGNLRQLFYEDGPTTTVAVERRPERVDGKVNTVLSVNGKVDASSVGDMETQVLLGQLPLLVAGRARSVLVIGMGSGVSAGSTLTHPVDDLTIVEIEPAIVRAQALFSEVNGRPLSDPRTTIRINDARNDLLVSDRSYDVIISEPSNPWISGPSKLFTREFFSLARSRLNAGGVLCQWVQLYGLDAPTLSSLLRTYADVFPHRAIFKGALGDLLILGSERELTLDAAVIAARMERPPVGDDLARVGIRSPADLLVRFRAGDEGIEAFIAPDGDVPLNTDDNALVEFAAARSLYRDDAMANEKRLVAIPDTVLRHLTRASVMSDLPAELAARLIRLGLLDRAAALVQGALGESGPGRTDREARLLALSGEVLMKKGDEDGARAAWMEALAIDARQPGATRGLAARLAHDGDAENAEAMLERASADPGCRLDLARLRFERGDAAGVIETLRPLRDPAPGWDPEVAPLACLYRGRALLATGRPGEAIAELRRYFDLFPEYPRPAERSIEAAIDLSRAYLAVGREDQAVAQFRVVTGLSDSLAAWNRRQSEQSIARGDLPAAVSYAREALRWHPGDTAALRALGATLNATGPLDEAIAAWNEIDRKLAGDEEALRNIAGLSLRAGRPDAALEAFRRLRAIESDPGALDRIESAISELEAAGRRRSALAAP